MRDIVFPDRNEEQFIARATTLGIRHLVFVYAQPAAFYHGKSDIPVTNALLVAPEKLDQAHAKASVVLVRSSDKDMHVVEHGRPHMLYGLETSPKHDALHQRASGLNHVLARLMEANKISLGFSFQELLAASPERRAVLLGRMTQNIGLCRKFKVPMKIASFARTPGGMRNPGDLRALFNLLGMHPAESARALD